MARQVSYKLHIELLLLLALLALVSAPLNIMASARFQRPAGAPDGLYLGVINEHGTKLLHFVGEGNYTAATVSFVSPRHSRRKLLDTGVHCEGSTYLSADDMNNAISGLANFFGNGNSLYARSVSYYSGGAVAFVCTYGNGQTYTANALRNDQSQISNACGNAVGGWNSHESWKSTYGRTSSNKGFC